MSFRDLETCSHEGEKCKWKIFIYKNSSLGYSIVPKSGESANM